MLLKFSDTVQEIGYFILRIGLGFMIMLHGYPKIAGGMERWTALGGVMSNFGIDFFPAFWGFMAAAAEFFGGIFLMLGLFFRPAAFFLVITMAVATAMHISVGDPFMPKVSYPLELGIVFLAMFFMGQRKWAIDNVLIKKYGRR
jgi:putative oxidoreductase